MSDSRMVILTALDVEYQAVRDRMTEVEVYRHQAGTRFEMGRLVDSDCQVALGLVGKGNQPAAVLSERAIAEFDPAALLFVGVAGALWPGVALGDVVVATHVYAYHGGTSEDDGLKARPRVWEISHGTDQIARHVARAGSWTRLLPCGEEPPRVRFGPIAAGEVVQDSTISAHARRIRQNYNDALAIEMEAAGVAQAGHLNKSLPVIVVRGISGRADGTKAATDGENWQPRAARHAAAFATALAHEITLEHNAGSPEPATAKTRSPAMNEMTRNIATGNARVGIQAGQIHGNVGNIWLGSPPDPTLSLDARIADLHDRIRLARKAGELDETTFAAAKEELAIVNKALPATTSHGQSRLLLALKRLRGLLDDVAGKSTITGPRPRAHRRAGPSNRKAGCRYTGMEVRRPTRQRDARCASPGGRGPADTTRPRRGRVPIQACMTAGTIGDKPPTEAPFHRL